MFELLLYSNITCAGAIDIIDRINAHEHMDALVKVELIEVGGTLLRQAPFYLTFFQAGFNPLDT